MNCNSCQSPIELERLEILPDTTTCSTCAKNGVGQSSRPKGVMVYMHKTSGFMQVVSAETHKDWKRYNPYGRNTGRGSGVHRMSRSTSQY